MTRALRALAINRRGKNSVRNLRYGPQTQFASFVEAFNVEYVDVGCNYTLLFLKFTKGKS